MRRAVLMIIDGLRADMVTPELTPSLHRIAAESRVFHRHRSVFPSATRVNSASIATGCYPAAHGLAGNAIALDEGAGLRPVSVGPAEFRERWRRATGRTLLRPTLAERLRESGGVAIHSNSSPGAAHMQDPDGHGWLYHRSGSHAPGLTPIEDDPCRDLAYDASGDARVTAHACAALAGGPRRALHVVWVCEPDHSQHALELGSPAHHAVVRGADECAARLHRAVQRLRDEGEDVLFVLASDHGHETVDAIVPVTDLLVGAGLKESADSSDVVLASSGMGALVYLDAAAWPRLAAIEEWLRAQPWTAEVFGGERLAEAGLPAAAPLAIAFGMAKREGVNRFGVPGLGLVAADPFTSNDRVGCGQHGGLGRYETRPFLLAGGGGFRAGPCREPSAAVDIAPTVLRHLGAGDAGVDGRALALS